MIERMQEGPGQIGRGLASLPYARRQHQAVTGSQTCGRVAAGSAPLGRRSAIAANDCTRSDSGSSLSFSK